MRHGCTVSVAALFAAGVICLDPSARGHASDPPIPCLARNGFVTLEVDPAGGSTQWQEISGTFDSWDAKTTVMGFKSPATNEVERIGVEALRFRRKKVSPTAQMAMPSSTKLGEIARVYPVADVTVADGVLSFPGCSATNDGNELVLEGTVTFTASEVRVEGTVLEIEKPRPGSRDSTEHKGG